MEKLTIKELAPYLPFNLGIKILNHKCDYVGIEFSEITGYYFIGHSLHVNYQDGSAGKSVTEFKPILRPLSDLTEEIEVNGKKFVPITKLITHGFHNSFWYDLETFNCKYLYNYDIEILLELHFDIYRLIEKGLAIDINTLEK